MRGQGVGKPLGEDVGRLHEGMFGARTDADAELLDEPMTGYVRKTSRREYRPAGHGCTDPRELQVHCYRILGSLQDAEDALQDTLLATWSGMERMSIVAVLANGARPAEPCK